LVPPVAPSTVFSGPCFFFFEGPRPFPPEAGFRARRWSRAGPPSLPGPGTFAPRPPTGGRALSGLACPPRKRPQRENPGPPPAPDPPAKSRPKVRAVTAPTTRWPTPPPPGSLGHFLAPPAQGCGGGGWERGLPTPPRIHRPPPKWPRMSRGGHLRPHVGLPTPSKPLSGPPIPQGDPPGNCHLCARQPFGTAAGPIPPPDFSGGSQDGEQHNNEGAPARAPPAWGPKRTEKCTRGPILPSFFGPDRGRATALQNTPFPPFLSPTPHPGPLRPPLWFRRSHPCA